MRTILVGYGTQGKKRLKVSKKEIVFIVDPYFKKADYKSVYDVPIEKYDSAILCIPDNKKFKIINYLISKKKDILVEKPLFKKFSNSEIKKIYKKSNKNKVVVYTAYNHRFEPNIIRMKTLISSKKLGKIYSCRMFYGNGTAKLVKSSPWKEKYSNIIEDLGSHLIDILFFWFGKNKLNLKILSKLNNENKSYDHIVLMNKQKKRNILFQLELSYCMWKNHFTCDVLASKGSAHISSLCKWDKTKFIFRKRKFPSGYPMEKIISEKKKDPTWREEFKYFKNLVKNRDNSSLLKDILISNELNRIF